MMDNGLTVTAVGTTITTGAASTLTAIPNASSGEVPRYIRVAATQACYVKLSTTATSAAATANDILVQPADAVVLQVPQGITKIAAIQDTVAGKCNVVPLENL